MAIFYYSGFKHTYKSRNFGDDINPSFLERYFDKAIIESKEVCLVGLGTLLNDNNVLQIEHYPKKVVFSSGVGYGPLNHEFDDSWDIACVRGPESARILGLPEEKGICDGAILINDYHKPNRDVRRDDVVLVPHISTTWSSGHALKQICEELGLIYLTPDVEFEAFIDTINRANLVVTEAMHGAIVADAVRTRWLPVKILFHEAFKWQDWFASLDLEYRSWELGPKVWNSNPGIMSVLKQPYVRLKKAVLKRTISNLMANARGYLSTDEVLENRLQRLRDVIRYINETYA